MGHFLYGLELECGVDYDLDISVGHYHNGHTLNDFWETQEDGSVCFGGDYRSVEFVSTVLRHEDVGPALDSLRLELGDTEVLENISINDSCGAHIHFSYVPGGRYRKARHLFRSVPFEYLKKIGQKAMRSVKKGYPDIYPYFKDQYFRQYARRLPQSLNQLRRYSEFNYTRNSGLEWRSFNLLGVSKWSEIKGMYKIAIDSIESVLGPELQKQDSFCKIDTMERDIEYKNEIEKLELDIKMGDMKKMTEYKTYSVFAKNFDMKRCVINV